MRVFLKEFSYYLAAIGLAILFSIVVSFLNPLIRAFSDLVLGTTLLDSGNFSIVANDLFLSLILLTVIVPVVIVFYPIGILMKYVVLSARGTRKRRNQRHEA
ncbi:hypothetical protein JOD17_001473 [Geomicrobium sediminis]|uniref:Uncharacterized protein n=1 Tax=Geomicrobium sediminis TaxID=1347788 RepID=A0ABS2PBC4_9BACL|nr:hypothetical protein [Geomicrobium sediminis]